MAIGVLIIARPGSGKSTSIRTLNPKETLLINVANKPLPFVGWKSQYTQLDGKAKTGNYVISSNADTILRVMEFVNDQMPHIKNIVLDDFNYMSGFELMSKVSEQGYAKFNSIAKHIFDVVTKPMTLREDLMVFFTNHPEVSVNSEGEERIKAKTAGRMVDQQIEVDGLFTYVLYGRARRSGKEIKYIFETQTDGSTVAKTPMGVFETFEIPNDLQFVRERILATQS